MNKNAFFRNALPMRPARPAPFSATRRKVLLRIQRTIIVLHHALAYLAGANVYEFSPLKYTLVSLAVPVFYELIIAVLFSATVRIIWKRPEFLKILFYYAGFGLPVALVAYAAGLLTGLSRAPALGSVLPAILALIAGLNIYVFGSENKYKVVVGYCLFVLIFMLFIGVETGSFQRERQREGYLIYLSQQEFRVRNFRKNLDLPSEMPTWLFGGDSK
jgi:hypothetical protein